MNKVIKAYQIARQLGLGFCFFRAWYEFRMKSGLMKRKFPTPRWSEVRLDDWLEDEFAGEPERMLEAHRSNGRTFFLDGKKIIGLNRCFGTDVTKFADDILQNRFRYFFDQTYSLGDGPDWFVSPLTGGRMDADAHWTEIKEFDPAVGDIKYVWEPSRFGWVYTLARAYAVTGDPTYAEKFWMLWESWLEANQPNRGPHYVCGQECALRLMAICFAFYAFSEAPASTVERKLTIVAAIAVLADRIEKNLDYAISTRTNHSISESAGLYTIGLLFPEFKRSGHWLKLGRKVITQEGLKQIYADGAYIQHSMNYHRLMLQDFLWVLRLAELNDDAISGRLIERVKKACEFLYQMHDTASGRVPNYGANDGALIFPLNSCDYLDYRGVLQAMHYMLKREKLFGSGPWDEDLVWFFGAEALDAPVCGKRKISSDFDEGGYYTLRTSESWAMMRCHSFKDRPMQADMLHLDLWWKGKNILRDSGTFMYNCDQPWQDYFGSTAAHNTVVVDHADQMSKASRFMWLNWLKAGMVFQGEDETGRVQTMEGEHYGYDRLGKVVHRRSVLTLGGNCWVVADDIPGSGTHDIGLFWHIGDVPCRLNRNMIILDTPDGPASLAVVETSGQADLELYHGDPHVPAGWQSLYYGNRQAVPSARYSKKGPLPVRLITIVCLGDVVRDVKMDENNLLTWTLENSGKAYGVGMNSITASAKQTFVFGQEDSKKRVLSSKFNQP